MFATSVDVETKTFICFVDLVHELVLISAHSRHVSVPSAALLQARCFCFLKALTALACFPRMW